MNAKPFTRRATADKQEFVLKPVRPGVWHVWYTFYRNGAVIEDVLVTELNDTNQATAHGIVRLLNAGREAAQ